ncbi:MAG: hypothetical protein ACXVHW_06155, partial [Methanobacterium sp.]
VFKMCNKYLIESGKNGTVFAYIDMEKNQITISLENTANPADPELNTGLTMDLTKFKEKFQKILKSDNAD